METELEAIEGAIFQKLVAIVDELGDDARAVGMDEVIPATGLIDSAGLMQLIAWYDERYKLALRQEEITIDNLGSVASMARFVLRRRTPDTLSDAAP